MIHDEPPEYMDDVDGMPDDGESYATAKPRQQGPNSPVAPLSNAPVDPDEPPEYSKTSSRRVHPQIDWPMPRAARKPGDAPSHAPDPRFGENTGALLDAYGIRVRHNLMRHALEMTIPNFTPAIERAENANLEQFLELCDRHGLSPLKSTGHLHGHAREYHPVQKWITAKAWDGVDRLPEIMATVQLAASASSELSGLLLTRWLTACARALLPASPSLRPFCPQGVLTLQGPQGIGKTQWIKSLAPPDSGWISTGRVLDPHDRDSVQQATSFWIVELGEVDATFRRSDVAALKAFVTSEVDIYRSAYARREERIPRRTVLAASVNRKDFLVDDTGNRRWWTLACEGLAWQHTIDTQQLWAQIYHMAASGAPWWLTPQETESLSIANREHEAKDPLIEDLWATWRPSLAAAGREPRHTIADIWACLPGRANKVRNRAESNALAQALRDAGCDLGAKVNGYAVYGVDRIGEAKRDDWRGWQHGGE